MALTTEEKTALKKAKAQGASKEEAMALLAEMRSDRPTLSQAFSENPDTLKKVQKTLGTLFGGEKIGEAIGTQIAKARATDDERELIEGPTAKEVAGDVLRTGAIFSPIGRIAGAVSKGARALGLTRGAQTIGNVAGGAATGAAADVGVSLSEGGNASLGLGTLLGAGIPAASPLAGALAKVAGKASRRAVFETSGVLSGTSEETLEAAFQAAKKGGKDLDEFTDALRSRANPEKLVNDLEGSVALVKSRQQELWKNTLGELAGTPVSTQPAKASFRTELEKAGISVSDNGLLDFSKSKLRTVPAAQTKIQQAWQEVSTMPETLDLGDLDTTRQAVKAIKEISGDEPSARLANKLVEDATRSVRTAGEQVEGYGKMLDTFGETSQFLDELEKGLSTGNRKSIDQTYRRIITTLRTNNEQRMALLQELDDATEGAITAQISGQQLSEFLPRGIIGRFFAPFIAGGAITGGLSSTMIPGLLFASPRIAGEFARAIGMTSAKASAFTDAVEQARNLLVKVGAIGGAQIESE